MTNTQNRFGNDRSEILNEDHKMATGKSGDDIRQSQGRNQNEQNKSGLQENLRENNKQE